MIDGFGLTILTLIIGGTVYYLYLRRKQSKLSDKRKQLIQSGIELDTEIKETFSDGGGSNWEQRVRSIPEPSLSPSLSDEIEQRLKYNEARITQRRHNIERVQSLKKRRNIVVRNNDVDLNPLQTDFLLQSFTDSDDDQFRQARFMLTVEESLTDLVGFHQVTLEHKVLSKFDSELAIEKVSSIRLPPYESEKVRHFHTISQLSKRLLAIAVHNSKISIEDAVSECNGSIEELDNLSFAVSVVDEVYDTFITVQKVENFIDDFDISHTSLTEKGCIEAINNVISNGNSDDLNRISTQIDTIAASQWESSDLYSIDWREFEQLIGDLWETKGYTTTVTSAQADSGFDVRAINNNDVTDHCLIEVKQFAEGNRVGRPIVQKTVGTLQSDRANRAIVVTSSSFTAPAIEEAQKVSRQMELIDGNDLIQELNTSSLAPPTHIGSNKKSNQYVPSFELTPLLYQLVEDSSMLYTKDRNYKNPDMIGQETESEKNSEGFAITRGKETCENKKEEKMEHPFGNVTNPNQEIRKANIDNVDLCPVCDAQSSIWTTKNINTRRRYKCQNCETVWRRKSAIIKDTTNNPDLNTVEPEQATSEESPSESECKIDNSMSENSTDAGYQDHMRSTSTTSAPTKHRREDAEVEDHSLITAELTEDNQLVEGNIISIELVGFESVRGTTHELNFEDDIDGLLIAMYFENKSSFSWYFYPREAASVVSDTGLTHRANNLPLYGIRLPGAWELESFELAPQSKYKMLFYFEQFDGSINKFRIKADLQFSLNKSKADVQGSETLELQFDDNVTNFSRLPSEIRSLFK